MIEEIEIPALPTLDEYAQVSQLSAPIQELRSEAAQLAARLKGRRVWMVNSTAQGGGVAEMLPRLVTLLRELDVDTRWLVIGTERAPFFELTKRIHNLIHGAGDPHFSDEDRDLYETVSREISSELNQWVDSNDVIVCHDPQPAGACALTKQERGARAVWRCHIGLDEQLPQTEAAWDFLATHLRAYDRFVFTASEYIPHQVHGQVSIIQPALDPFAHKNRHLFTHKLVGVLCNAGLLSQDLPVVTPPFDHQVERLQGNGEFAPATQPDEIGLLSRPIITQISRWDALKGWQPLLEGFADMKRRLPKTSHSGRPRRALELCRLVLAGPEPAAVQDDPEAKDVLDKLIETYVQLEPDIQKDIALLSLPMALRKENALIVNALQRCSSIVVQNSLREGFGLTVAEAMWKRVAVLGSDACGIRQQIRNGIDGVLNPEPESPERVSELLESLLVDHKRRHGYGAHGERRVSNEFLVFGQAARWLRVLAETVDPPSPSRLPPR